VAFLLIALVEGVEPGAVVNGAPVGLQSCPLTEAAAERRLPYRVPKGKPPTRVAFLLIALVEGVEPGAVVNGAPVGLQSCPLTEAAAECSTPLPVPPY